MTAGASAPTDYEAKRVLDFQLGNGTPATLYAALLTDTNSVTTRRAGTYTEVSTGTWTNYARVAITNNTTNWPAASGANPAVKSNANIIDFGTATTTGNVTVTAWAVFDASTAGNMKLFSDFVDGSNNQLPQIVQNGNPVSFAASALQVKL